MACLKLHGSVMSTAAMRAIVCLIEKELELELVPVNMATGDHKKEPFISLNPFGQVPALEDGDLKLFGQNKRAFQTTTYDPLFFHSSSVGDDLALAHSVQ
ncbi:hypothetical protein MRB53_029127 [Persea americana]|uniref:Uncharacterized protein n=1 Tax=Persea americana TaxID=3435 RepID=A0ACC2KHV9_PERAE|nr:hypothetical protein MRB53_029127 [Persea americana]